MGRREIHYRPPGASQQLVLLRHYYKLIMTMSVILEVTKVTGITTTMLRSERPLSVVFPFLDWVITITSHVSDATHTLHYPVLVAHNGFAFDFPILLAEVERRPQQLRFSESSISATRCHFYEGYTYWSVIESDY